MMKQPRAVATYFYTGIVGAQAYVRRHRHERLRLQGREPANDPDHPGEARCRLPLHDGHALHGGDVQGLVRQGWGADRPQTARHRPLPHPELDARPRDRGRQKPELRKPGREGSTVRRHHGLPLLVHRGYRARQPRARPSRRARRRYPAGRLPEDHAELTVGQVRRQRAAARPVLPLPEPAGETVREPDHPAGHQLRDRHAEAPEAARRPGPAAHPDLPSGPARACGRRAVLRTRSRRSQALARQGRLSERLLDHALRRQHLPAAPARQGYPERPRGGRHPRHHHDPRPRDLLELHHPYEVARTASASATGMQTFPTRRTGLARCSRARPTAATTRASTRARR